MTAPAVSVPVRPLPLTYAEGADLRSRIEHAISGAMSAFLDANVVRDTRGTPIGGPDPRAVQAETVLVLARWLARAGLDLVDARVFEEKLRRLEAELAGRRNRRGANWTDPGTGEACFWTTAAPNAVGGETCEGCGKHIRDHYGNTEYRCEPRADAVGTAPGNTRVALCSCGNAGCAGTGDPDCRHNIAI